MRKAGFFFIAYFVFPASVLLQLGFHLDGELLDESINKYEVVYPKQLIEGRWRRSLDTLSPNGHHDQTSFSLDGFGRRLILQLSRNRLLLPEGSKTSFYSFNGIQSRPFKSIDNCYYQGIIKGLQGSSVTLSTCQGIEGLVFDGKESFYIQPSETKNNETNTTPHIMFKMKDLKLPKVLCGQEDEGHVLQILHAKKDKRIRRNIDSETKYIELVMVNDNKQYKHYMENTTKRALKIANLVDSLYRPLNVRVALIELIIWNDKDKIEVKEDSSTTLENFVKWRNDVLIKEKKLYHDNAQLLTHIDFKGQTVGKAHVFAICTSRSAGVVQDHSSNAAATAATFAHEMGHNLGLNHDKDDCVCAAKKKNQACIMSGVARYEPATAWSSCSFEEFKAMLDKGLDSCLFNRPKKLFGDPVCGNGFKEEGEECDCGNSTECKKYSDSCCNPATCKLLSHADCDEGPCCKKCKFRSSNVVCREKGNECDLPEYCNGSSSWCPSNKFVQNGRNCAGGKGYCYEGICPTHDSQCKILWGNEAKSGPKLCYTINRKGTYHGSCKSDNGTFAPCKLKDIYCGMLHCTETTTDLPIIGTERYAYKYEYHTKDGTIQCRSAALDLGHDVPDPGMAKEGTKCGNNKICLGQECVNITQLFLVNPKCPGDCSRNGICNNEGECFCDDCWGERDCSKSVPCKHGSDSVGSSKLAGYVILVFLCIGLVAGCIGAFVYRNQLKAKWQERQQAKQKRYRSVNNKASLSPTQKNASEPTVTDPRKLPAVTIAPKPSPLPPPSRPIANRQPGKIELPSWPIENKNDGEAIPPIQRKKPPFPSSVSKQPYLNRASSPPTGSYDSNPANSGPRPGSYAGVLDKETVSKAPIKPAPLTRPLHPPSTRPILPGEKPPLSSKKTGSEKTFAGESVRPQPHKPARMPPPPPSNKPSLPTKR